MPPSKTKLRPLTEALLEMAADQHRIGVMGDAAYRKITIRHLGPQTLAYIGTDQRRRDSHTARESKLEPGGVRRYLNLTVGYISQLERGTKQPKGPALTLLNLIRRKGLEAII